MTSNSSYRLLRGLSRPSYSCQTPRASIKLPNPYRCLSTTSTPTPAPQPPKKPDPQLNKPEPQPPIPQAEPKLGLKVAQAVRRHASSTTEPYIAYGATDMLYKECARQAPYSFPPDRPRTKTPAGEDLGVGEGYWYHTLNLKPTFSTWAQITMLHMYMLLVRLRCFPPAQAPPWQQHLVDHFFHDAEARMATLHGIHSASLRSRYLKDLFVQYRGAIAAYDEGLCKGDAVLATALWRNVFAGDVWADFEHVAAVVAHVRRHVAGLDGVSDEVLVRAEMRFAEPGAVGLVRARSRGLGEPFGGVVRETNETNETTMGGKEPLRDGVR
ncbi:MAG: Protein cbp3, mitochondrial [Trizodia sp. TS-e1964]|nr:MAG: Protein cbp3, mitochondrial [Trizodia sp. TS-e1964]